MKKIMMIAALMLLGGVAMAEKTHSVFKNAEDRAAVRQNVAK